MRMCPPQSASALCVKPSSEERERELEKDNGKGRGRGRKREREREAERQRGREAERVSERMTKIPRASSSSKKITQGADARPREKTWRTALSDSPTYLLKPSSSYHMTGR